MIVTFQKIWHNSNFAQVTSEHANSQLYMYIKESPVEIRTVTQWGLIGCSMTACCLCYLPAILVHIGTTAVSFQQGKIWRAFKKCYNFLYFFFKKLHKSKVHKLGSACILGSNVFSGYYGLNRHTFHDYLFIECWLYLVPMKKFVLPVEG